MARASPRRTGRGPPPPPPEPARGPAARGGVPAAAPGPPLPPAPPARGRRRAGDRSPRRAATCASPRGRAAALGAPRRRRAPPGAPAAADRRPRPARGRARRRWGRGAAGGGPPVVARETKGTATGSGDDGEGRLVRRLGHLGRWVCRERRARRRCSGTAGEPDGESGASASWAKFACESAIFCRLTNSATLSWLWFSVSRSTMGSMAFGAMASVLGGGLGWPSRRPWVRRRPSRRAALPKPSPVWRARAPAGESPFRRARRGAAVRARRAAIGVRESAIDADRRWGRPSTLEGRRRGRDVEG